MPLENKHIQTSNAVTAAIYLQYMEIYTINFFCIEIRDSILCLPSG